MNIVKVMTSYLCIVLAAVLTEAKDWHGIVPLHSTRADVEKLLGSPSEPGGTTYGLGNESASIVYASGSPCAEGWRVPRDTVIRITVYSQARLKLSDLRLDESKYKKEDDLELFDFSYYTNTEEGLRITVQQGRVDSITYLPAAQDIYLSCPSGPREARCPRGTEVEITAPSGIVPSGTEVKLDANTVSVYPDLHLTYNWKVSAGRIISGQNTHQVTIDTSGLSSQCVTATVEIDGLPKGCPKSFSNKVRVINTSRNPGKIKRVNAVRINVRRERN